MQITPEQYARIEHSMPVQRGNVKLSNLQFLNTLLYVAEHGSLQGQSIYLMTIDDPDIVMATGNEGGGANAFWKPGGLTDPGGMREAVLNNQAIFHGNNMSDLINIIQCSEGAMMDSQENLLRRALEAGEKSAFLVGDQPYFYNARQEFTSLRMYYWESGSDGESIRFSRRFLEL